MNTADLQTIERLVRPTRWDPAIVYAHAMVETNGDFCWESHRTTEKGAYSLTRKERGLGKGGNSVEPAYGPAPDPVQQTSDVLQAYLYYSSLFHVSGDGRSLSAFAYAVFSDGEGFMSRLLDRIGTRDAATICTGIMGARTSGLTVEARLPQRMRDLSLLAKKYRPPSLAIYSL